MSKTKGRTITALQKRGKPGEINPLRGRLKEPTKEETGAEDAAREIYQWLQSACQDAAASMREPDLIPGVTGDDLWNDPDELQNLIGDKLWEYPKTWHLVILAKLGVNAHPALEKAIRNIGGS